MTEYKTTMTDNELVKLVDQYAKHYLLKFRHIWKLHAEYEDIYGELAAKACESRERYGALVKKTSGVRTYVVRAMKKHMLDHKKYLYIRQRKWPMMRIVEC